MWSPHLYAAFAPQTEPLPAEVLSRSAQATELLIVWVVRSRFPELLQGREPNHPADLQQEPGYRCGTPPLPSLRLVLMNALPRQAARVRARLASNVLVRAFPLPDPGFPHRLMDADALLLHVHPPDPLRRQDRN